MAQANSFNGNAPSRKRKEPPTASKQHNNAGKFGQNKKQKTEQQQQRFRIQRDARTLSTQSSSTALSNGALDVEKFVAAREFEMRALEQGMQRSKKALNRRAFQQVPHELRRRTASHDVRRVPKRWKERAAREMAEDNTPTGAARRRKPTRHMRLRLEAVKRLRALGAQKKAAKAGKKIGAEDKREREGEETSTSVTTRVPNVKKNKTAVLAKPPLPKAKFRKRQIHKSWLPTHLFHAKRAHMTPPSAPLWRFAIPLTPTQKSYRPTHRASHERGAIAWDTSYTATIGLEGQQSSVEGMLKALRIGDRDGTTGEAAWGARGEKWRRGTRVLEAFAFEREAPYRLIAPVTIVWCVSTAPETDDGKMKRKAFLRVHPSAFSQIWEEVVRLAKVAKPSVTVEDLRFELGSIEIAGPGSTEALLGALWPRQAEVKGLKESTGGVEKAWESLPGVTNLAMLPASALLAFNVQDPRLHHPPRTIAPPTSQEDQNKLIELLASWPVDREQKPAQLFDHTSRLRGTKLASQKSVNRRKSLAPPGHFPDPIPADPSIPILLHTTTHPSSSSLNLKTDHSPGAISWTLLAPWKAIRPLWYSIMYCPLSTGQQPRIGGLREMQQLAFEAGRPWFPADFPGTKAGWEWEVQEREKRWREWKRRPKGKRASWEKVELGGGKKGEVGVGWSCDWDMLVGVRNVEVKDVQMSNGENHGENNTVKKAVSPAPPTKPANLTHLTSAHALALLKSEPSSLAIDSTTHSLMTVRITLLTRGVPQTCARIYRLPHPDSSTSADSEQQLKLRNAWLAPLSADQPSNKQKRAKHALSKGDPAHLVQRRLAQDLLAPVSENTASHPECPGEEDLIGFVTTGNFNLAEGRGTGVGCLLMSKALEGENAVKELSEGRLCVVRNAGNGIGRLARWEVA